MANVQHTVSGAGAPSVKPPSLGAHYTDTTTGKRWISSGISTIDDWGDPLPEALRIVDDSALEMTLAVDVSMTVWRTNSAGVRSLNLPKVTKPGAYEFVLVLENGSSSDRNVRINNAGDVGAVIETTTLVSRAGTATYFRWSCWQGQNPNSTPTYWQVLEQAYYTDPPARYSELNDASGAGSTMVLTGEFSRYVWNWSQNVARTLLLAPLSMSIPLDFYREIELIVWNQTAQAQTINIDTTQALPLVGHPTLPVPASSCLVFKLAYFVGLAQYRWTLVSTHTL
ncbi:hypothetical protein [Pseudomonas gingeri]|uniref:hypothetical protein n=1 Tax=Pseudomonas gingeri TaxID=117681 RepID=UPI0015BD3864|nr:hypothetical protein [Pseudomonas gingeri]NWD49013.1 hypothetical protein [Pseudomonas gingeri]